MLLLMLGPVLLVSVPDTQIVEEDLVARCQAGEHRAFDQLFQQQLHRTYKVCCSLLGSSAEADDAVQVVFTRAFMSIAKYDARRGRFSSWLYAIALGVVRNMRRGGRRRDRLGTAYGIEQLAGGGHGPDPAREAETRDTLARVRAAVDRLPEKKRTAFVLHHGAGLSLTEVAEATGSSVQTTAARIKSAREEIVRRMPKELQLAPGRAG